MVPRVWSDNDTRYAGTSTLRDFPIGLLLDALVGGTERASEEAEILVKIAPHQTDPVGIITS